MIKYIYNDEVGSIELIDSMGSDASIVNAARVSFFKDNQSSWLFNERDEKLINYLAKHKHTSPFEHVVATFRITVPIFIRSQIMRHRTFSYNEVSRRYTSDKIKLWHPDSWRGQSDINLQCSTGEITDEIASEIYQDALAISFKAYRTLLDRGIAREQARAALPQGAYTTFYMTGNLHNWVHFLRLRLDEHAQKEVRLLAQAIKDELAELYPASMNALL